MFNSTVLGRVGSDPAQRQAGKSTVAAFSIAVDQIKRRDQPEPPAFWIGIDVWGIQAEYAMNNIRKGDLVVVAGDVQQQSWTDKNTGETKTKLVVNCSRIMRVGRKGEGGGGQGQQSGGSTQQAWNSDGGNSFDDEDVPF